MQNCSVDSVDSKIAKRAFRWSSPERASALVIETKQLPDAWQRRLPSQQKADCRAQHSIYFADR
ncbi:hypothetical protein RB8101 [Rhodopirellula baltica SH 1]|uniref:Uncharacterized protein n=1 Tax=Rhodopirellula baltica (strain DSM 10527 / NCIMB 13988 / SH1) TaxID=243090 RepID=Q7UG59_RHOBA|nr:hypothetical protein RB8101 [Rhodopirellula baltica SH 1]